MNIKDQVDNGVKEKRNGIHWTITKKTMAKKACDVRSIRTLS